MNGKTRRKWDVEAEAQTIVRELYQAGKITAPESQHLVQEIIRVQRGAMAAARREAVTLCAKYGHPITDDGPHE